MIGNCSNGYTLALSIIIRGSIAAVRQELHASGGANFPSSLFLGDGPNAKGWPA